MSEKNKNLTQCKACGETVSKKAKTCPHCGQKNPAKKKSGTLSIIVIVFMGIYILGSLGQMPGNKSTSSNSSNLSVPKTSKEIFAQQYPDNAGKALAECARKIAGYFGLEHQAGNIPAPSYSDFKNSAFTYSWSKDSMELQSVFGKGRVSASCDGTLNPLKVQYVSVNGKEAYKNY